MLLLVQLLVLLLPSAADGSASVKGDGIAGAWQCCFGIDSCGSGSGSSVHCPAAKQPGCGSESQCDACGEAPTQKTVWCETMRCPATESHKLCTVPSNADPPLLQTFRPPRQTAAQAAAIAAITAKAGKNTSSPHNSSFQGCF